MATIIWCPYNEPCLQVFIPLWLHYLYTLSPVPKCFVCYWFISVVNEYLLLFGIYQQYFLWTNSCVWIYFLAINFLLYPKQFDLIFEQRFTRLSFYSQVCYNFFLYTVTSFSLKIQQKYSSSHVLAHIYKQIIQM